MQDIMNQSADPHSEGTLLISDVLGSVSDSIEETPHLTRESPWY